MADTPRKYTKNQLDHVGFFRLCEFIRNNEEKVRACTTYTEVIAMVLKDGDLVVSDNAVKNALEAVNIQITKPHSPSEAHQNNTRILTRCLVRLYAKLGEEIPSELVAMYERLEGKPCFAARNKPAAPPVPIDKIVDPKTIPVVNKGETPKP